MSDKVLVPVEFLTVIRSALNDGESTEVWSACRDLVRYLEFGEAEAAPEPVSAEPVVCLEISNESYRFKVANQDALIALDDGEHWLYAHPLAQECEPITKYVELTREQAFEHLKTNSFHLERTGLYKLVINPDWKPSPPE